ncbi:hypothetical protein [Paraburkholderia unamae]|uniref:Uncharacterized protein n=1 Tax=Paraburkholderia unamae TaxID=219649 RepID=A0ABX5KKM5_9BURK|nr:hypothetical protein [Paraburkholderia unamae]PVX82415.1 hypothetical protein C7402_109269 [Paraburkholderia unamae]
MDLAKQLRTVGIRWRNRPRMPKYKDMRPWAQGIFFAVGGIESAYWCRKVREIAPYVENSANHAFFSVATLGSTVVLGLLAVQAAYFTGMAIQCGKYLQEKIFE